MIKSMTGFGKGETKGKLNSVKVEARTVNHKFLEISMKLPEGFLSFEDKIRKLVGEFVKRGKVNLNVIYEDNLDSADKILINEKVAKAYYRQLLKLKDRINLEGSVRLDQLITLPGVITYESKKLLSLNVWSLIRQALRSALKNLDESRLKEGKAIYIDFNKRVRNIESAMNVIKQHSKTNVNLYRERFKKSIRELSNDSITRFDKGRLEQEVALYAKNSDITEEITRISAHIKNLKDSLKNYGEVGKKVDFISQELSREINTIGSKASDFKISGKVILVKSEIEKLREQAKNVE